MAITIKTVKEEELAEGETLHYICQGVTGVVGSGGVRVSLQR